MTPPPAPPSQATAEGTPAPRGPEREPAAATPASRNSGGQLAYETAPVGRPPGYPLDQQEPIYLPLALSVGAGFKFGCGFMMAVTMTALVVFLVLSIVFFVATLIGIPLPLIAPQ